MPGSLEDARERLQSLPGSVRRLLDYVALLEGDARYAVLRHMARATEEDMVVDLKEAVEAGLLAVVEGQPNVYDFTDEELRKVILAEIGEQRLPKLRERAEAARRRVTGR